MGKRGRAYACNERGYINGSACVTGLLENYCRSPLNTVVWNEVFSFFLVSEVFCCACCSGMGDVYRIFWRKETCQSPDSFSPRHAERCPISRDRKIARGPFPGFDPRLTFYVLFPQSYRASLTREVNCAHTKKNGKYSFCPAMVTHLCESWRGINMMSKYILSFSLSGSCPSFPGISRSSCCIICLFSSSVNQ